MATDLVQRAAAICGFDRFLMPSSDQLAAWLEQRAGYLCIEFFVDEEAPRWKVEYDGTTWWHADLLSCLSAAVVEVDRIEREAKQP